MQPVERHENHIKDSNKRLLHEESSSAIGLNRLGEKDRASSLAHMANTTKLRT